MEGRELRLAILFSVLYLNVSEVNTNLGFTNFTSWLNTDCLLQDCILPNLKSVHFSSSIKVPPRNNIRDHRDGRSSNYRSTGSCSGWSSSHFHEAAQFASSRHNKDNHRRWTRCLPVPYVHCWRLHRIGFLKNQSTVTKHIHIVNGATSRYQSTPEHPTRQLIRPVLHQHGADKLWSFILRLLLVVRFFSYCLPVFSIWSRLRRISADLVESPGGFCPVGLTCAKRHKQA